MIFRAFDGVQMTGFSYSFSQKQYIKSKGFMRSKINPIRPAKNHDNQVDKVDPKGLLVSCIILLRLGLVWGKIVYITP